jgi:integrase
MALMTVKRVQKLLRAGVRGRYTDGKGGVKGLMLCVESPTSAAWVLRWQRDHKTRHMGLGSALKDSSRYLSLAAAREKAREQYERLARGIDPLELRRQEREAQRQAEARLLTFREAAERCHEAKSAEWSNAHHANEFISSLRRWVFPIFGGIDVAAVGRDDVLRCLEQRLPGKMGVGAATGTFWTARSQTADRTRARIQQVLDWAEVRGFRPAGTPNPARWKGFLDQLLAKPRKIAPQQNLAAVPFTEVPQVMAALAAEESVGAQCLRFIVLTTCRLGEALRTTWDEIDFEAREWRVPPERMKARKEHRVPLSPQAVELLRSLYREEGNPHLFISTKTPGTHVAETTVTAALRKTGRRETIHGFRSSFSTWAHERSRFSNHVIELSLAHSVGSTVERAYRRTDLPEQRRKLLAAWGAFCTTPPVAGEKGKVLPMRRG